MTRPITRLHYVELALVTTAVAATVPLYGAFFATTGYLAPMLTAVGVGTALATLSAILRWRIPLTAFLAALAFVLLAAYIVLPGSLRNGVPTHGTLRTLCTGITSGWVKMLTVGLPAEGTGELLLTPTLFLYAASIAAATVTLRTRPLLAPTLIPLCSLLAGLLPTASRPHDALPVAAVVLTATLILTLIRAVRMDSIIGGSHVAGRTLSSLPVLLLIAAAGVSLAQFVPLGSPTRYDPRRHIKAPLEVEESLNPLVTLRSELEQAVKDRKAGKSHDLFTVRIDEGSPAVDRVRLAALDDFDGSMWSCDSVSWPAGHELAEDPELTHADMVTMHVKILGLDRPFLPVAGWPTKLGPHSGGANAIGFSADSGVLSANADVRQGLSYELVTEVRPRRSDAMPVTLTDDATPDYRLPPEMDDFKHAVTAGPKSPYEKLEALARSLSSRPNDLNARPGHSLGRLDQLFAKTGETRGYDEQYAAAFAVMARSLHYRARVATGYHLRSPLDGTYTVQPDDAYAWAEVYMKGYGWMAFDPANRARVAGAKTPDSYLAKQVPKAVPAPPDDDQPKAAPAQPGPTRRFPWDRTLIVLAFLLVLAIALPLAVVAEKWRRTYTRRRGTPEHRVAGAWRQSTDRLREAGVPIQRSWTPLETAAEARTRLGETAAPVTLLAPLIGAARYSPQPPAPEDADDAWRADHALSAALLRDRGHVTAFRAWINPRPLFSRNK